jgi:hypothetical protein
MSRHHGEAKLNSNAGFVQCLPPAASEAYAAFSRPRFMFLLLKPPSSARD